MLFFLLNVHFAVNNKRKVSSNVVRRLGIDGAITREQKRFLKSINVFKKDKTRLKTFAKERYEKRGRVYGQNMPLSLIRHRLIRWV